MTSRQLEVRSIREQLRCPECGGAAPVAALGPAGGSERAGSALKVHSLTRDYRIGRSAECEIQIEDPGAVLSRTHASLFWGEKGFEVADAGSDNGTRVNGLSLRPGDRRALRHGDRISLGGVELVFFDLAGGAPAAGEARPLPYDRLLHLLREMNSLDAAVVVERSLELLRLASGVQRSYLVDAGADPRLRALLTPLDDPSLRVSRSTIEEALAGARKVSRFLAPNVEIYPTQSIAELKLRRIWASPVLGAAGRPLAAVYLDSAEAGARFDDETERVMDALVDQIGMALRNASLHAEVVALTEGLERKVADRTRELEESRALLVGQDRLATLGRLVAAIAHELNNPAGAMLSLAQTLRSLLEPLTRVGDDLAAAFPDPARAAEARRFLDAALSASGKPVLDTRARRALEGRLTERLAAHGVDAADTVARRLARAGMTEEEVSVYLGILGERGEFLSGLAEKLHTFGKGLATIGECSGNIARIVDGLKTYAHLDRARSEAADVHQGIEAALSLLSSRVPWGVQVVTRFEEFDPFLQRPGELIQVWTNLIDNAVRAMGEKGVLTIETHDEGDRVRVLVADTGSGIPDAIKDRIFDLDATTRGPGAGLGLGLPICRTIVEKNHAGAITFESRPGRTVFTVTVPKKQPIPPSAQEP